MMKKWLVILSVSLMALPMTAFAGPRFVNSTPYFKKAPAPLFGARSPVFKQSNPRAQARFRAGNRSGRFQRFGNRGRGFNRGFNTRFNQGFNQRQGFPSQRRFNNPGGGFIQLPGSATTFNRGFRNFNQPGLTLTRKQLFFQRYLRERAESKRRITGSKDSTLDLNRDILGGPLAVPNRGAFGGDVNIPFSFQSAPQANGNNGIQNTQPAEFKAGKSKSIKNKRRQWNPRRLKKANPSRGVISSIPITPRQKARLNF